MSRKIDDGGGKGAITIFITQRINDFYVSTGASEVCAYGKTVEEAVGNLVIKFQRRFRVKVAAHPCPNEIGP